jgi:hypothetical protein
VLIAATLVLVAIAVGLAAWLAGPHRPGLALAALLVPLAVTAPTTVRDAVDRTIRTVRLGPTAAALVAPRAAERGRNVPLTLAAERRIPPQSTYGIVMGRRLPGPRGRDRFYGIAWTSFRLAPRISVRGSEARWVLLYDATPEDAGIPGRRAWRFGDDWLIQR